MAIAVLKSSLSGFANDIETSERTRWFKLSTATWLNNAMLWAIVVFIASAYCYLHAYITQDPDISMLHSFAWGATRWSLWGVASPLLVAYLIYKTQSSVNEKNNAIIPILIATFYTLLIVFISAIVGAYFGAIGAKLESIISVIYRDFPLKLFVLFACYCAHKIWYSNVQPAALDIDSAQADSNPANTLNYLWVIDGKQKKMLNTVDICWVKACGNYLEIHTSEKSYLLRKTLKSLKDELPQEGFVQIHRSKIVNKSKIATLHNKPSGEAIMTLSNAVSLTVSKTFRPQLSMIN